MSRLERRRAVDRARGDSYEAKLDSLLVRTLQAKPAPISELAAEIGVSICQVGNSIRRLRARGQVKSTQGERGRGRTPRRWSVRP